MPRGRITFGDSQLQRAVQRYGDELIEEVKRIVIETASIIHGNAKALAPTDDGNLRDSIEMEILEGGLLAVVRVTASYAIYVNYGTGIYASQGGGRQTPWTYFSPKLNRFVRTQGQRPQEFWEPALELGERHFNAGMEGLG